MYYIPYTVYYMVCNLYYIMHSIYCMPYTVYEVLYIMYYIPYAIHYVYYMLCTIRYTLHTMYRILYSVYYVSYTRYSRVVRAKKCIPGAVNYSSILHALYCLHTMYCILRLKTECRMLETVHCIRKTLYDIRHRTYSISYTMS